MKRIPAIITVLVLVLILCAGCISQPPSPSAATATPTPQDLRPHYRIGVDAEFPPFTWQAGNGSYYGLDIEAARWVARQKGFEVTFVALPWENAVASLNDGSVDIIWSGMTVTEERRAAVNFSAPYYSVNESIAARADSLVTMEDFHNGRLRVGAQAGSSGEKWVEQNLIQPGTMPASRLIQYDDITTLSDALVNNTVDVSIIQTPSQRRMTIGRPIMVIGTIPSTGSYAVAVRKTDPRLLEDLNEGLVLLQNDPAWSRFLKDYDLEP